MSFGSPYASPSGHGHRLGSSWAPGSWATPVFGGSVGASLGGRAGFSPYSGRYAHRAAVHSGGMDSGDGLTPVSKARTMSTAADDESSWRDVEHQSGFVDEQDMPGREVMDGYLAGQVGNACRAGVWWTVFGAVMLSLFRGNVLGIGAMRSVFNLAMLVFSPLTGSWGERTSIRLVLIRTTLARAMIYVVALPGLWLLLASGWLWQTEDWMYPLFCCLLLLLLFMDGGVVAFANVADVDCGGIDLVASQYGASIDDALRGKFHAMHELAFNGSILLLAPAVAAAMYWSGHRWPAESDAAAMLGVLAAFFLVTTTFSLLLYGVRMPSLMVAQRGASLLPSAKEAIDIAFSIAEGFKLCWKSRAMRWRVIFLALETSIEDTLVSLILVELSVVCLAQGQFALGTLYATGMVSFGKIGGLLGARLTHRFWRPSEEDYDSGAAYRPLLYCVLLGSTSTLLLPFAAHVHGHDTALGHALAFGSVFLYFLMTAPPKVGFALLLQRLASETESSGRVFGFVSAFLTVTDSVVMMATAVVFHSLEIETALWSACGMIAALGCAEFVTLLANMYVGSEAVPLRKESDSIAGKSSYTFIQ